MEAMEKKDVLELVLEEEVPRGKKTLQTMRRYQLETDLLEYIMQFRARLVASGNMQKGVIDFTDTFSPGMAALRLFLALCMIFKLTPHQCHVNTAYLNALLKIIHYIKNTRGFPCPNGFTNLDVNGMNSSRSGWNMKVSLSARLNHAYTYGIILVSNVEYFKINVFQSMIDHLEFKT
ncbi:LOW QUALITY PROTEIN: reverse transcriptase [Phytophthora megakarya]|uniref:Reverse transcriptase n=1 Tax=Phytophthora megakarya TaxID=4795 RepID=A0A225X3S3_9STRA|nr:LOW QUALITY PROTEIN: reverse transcriptase [Phytophthora megakarya]